MIPVFYQDSYTSNESGSTVDQVLVKKLGLPEREERFIAQWLKLEFTALGSFLYRTLLPTKISNVLRNSKVQFLSLEFDDALTDIPWELMYDGELL